MNDKFFVHVVESPGDFDLLDGRTEGRVLLEALNISGVSAVYNLVTSRNALDEALGSRLEQAAAYYQLFPVLHFSLHSDEQGISLTDGHFISWHDLRQFLLPINQRLGGALLVALSSCFGAAGCRMAMYENQPIPFTALVGHPDSAAWSDAAIGFAAFYHRLRGGSSIFDAVAAMRAASGDDRFMVFVGSSVQQNFAQYLRDQRVQKALRDLLSGVPPASKPFEPGSP